VLLDQEVSEFARLAGQVFEFGFGHLEHLDLVAGVGAQVEKAEADAVGRPLLDDVLLLFERREVVVDGALGEFEGGRRSSVTPAPSSCLRASTIVNIASIDFTGFVADGPIVSPDSATYKNLFSIYEHQFGSGRTSDHQQCGRAAGLPRPKGARGGASDTAGARRSVSRKGNSK